MPTAAADEAGVSVSPNVGLVSAYVSRGLMLNWDKPAIQGSVEIGWPAGGYLGFFGSQVSGNFYAGGTAELDVYAGRRGTFDDALSYDIGLAGYFYPGANYRKAFPVGTYPDKGYDTVEAIFGMTYRWLGIKYSQCLTDYFGYDSRTVPISVWNSGVLAGVEAGRGTRGSGYLEANAAFDVGDYSLSAHAGHQTVAHGRGLDYSDFRLGAVRKLPEGWSASLAVSATRGAEAYLNFLSVAGNGEVVNVGGTHWVLGVNRAF